MSIQMSVGDLRALGLQIDPDNPTQAIPAGPQAESVPDESWDLERLGNYAATGLSEASRLQKESISSVVGLLCRYSDRDMHCRSRDGKCRGAIGVDG